MDFFQTTYLSYFTHISSRRCGGVVEVFKARPKGIFGR
jgi:hypothetical protein